MAINQVVAGTAPSFSYYSALYASTAGALHKGGKWVDIWSKGNPTLDWLRKKNQIGYDGGSQIEIVLAYTSGDGTSSYSDLDPLTIARPDQASKYFQKWSQYHFPVVLSGHDMRVNRGKAATAKLMKQQFRMSMTGAKETLSAHLWKLGTDDSEATGNGGKDIVSIPQIVSSRDAAGSNFDIDLYGIDASANSSYWDAQTQDCTGTITTVTFPKMLRLLYLNCCKDGNGDPDFGITDYQSYGMYLAALDNRVRYTQTEKADVGFKGVECMGATVFPDSYVPDVDNGYNYDSGSWADGSWYFLNSEYLHFAILSGADFAPDEPQKPVDQDGMVINHFFEGNLYCTRRNCHGVAFDIPSTITAA